MFVYEPGIALRGQLTAGWLDRYEQLLERGDRRGAFAWMVKNAGFAPGPIGSMPLAWVRFLLRPAIRGRQWAAVDELLEANLVEHRLLEALDAPDADRFSTIAARTVLLGGADSPGTLSDPSCTNWPRSSRTPPSRSCPASATRPPQNRPKRVAAAMLAEAGDIPG